MIIHPIPIFACSDAPKIPDFTVLDGSADDGPFGVFPKQAIHPPARIFRRKMYNSQIVGISV
ncbi:hypothetical protein [Deinococcus marmoris]|uniref:hypothetical protein n=1 Tax=Deinococcus marmoris TaxID=249408 RepID=UPI0012DDE370|nr:hypothetical protein [Deinococcus marmoris]